MATCAAAVRTTVSSVPFFAPRRREADMNAPFNAARLSRRALLKGGVLTVAFAWSGTTTGLLEPAAAQGAPPRNLDPNSVDAFFAIGADGRVTLYCGKV